MISPALVKLHDRRLFGGDVRPSAASLGDAEVEHLRVAARGDEDVRRLDVAVEDARRVRRVQRVDDLERDADRVCLRHGRAGDHPVERAALEVLHRDERAAVRLADVVDRADAGMVQRRGRFRFAVEAIAGTGSWEI